ncbi:MAG: hypothetical protein JWO38_3976 [Gemmataceae bacterium]|nr:hypothetical protein [Gemmataceae bacterium]
MTGSRLRSSSRSGAAAVWVLVVLAVVSGLSMAAAARLGYARKQVESYRNRAQAEWLARSGYELAVGRLLADPEYSGEKVSPIPEGEITIVVRKHLKKESVFQVECEARYRAGPDAVVHTIRRALKRHTSPQGVRIETVPDEP